MFFLSLNLTKRSLKTKNNDRGPKYVFELFLNKSCRQIFVHF